MSWSPPRFPVPLRVLCGVFLASLTLLVCSLLAVINKVAWYLEQAVFSKVNITSLLFHLS